MDISIASVCYGIFDSSDIMSQCIVGKMIIYFSKYDNFALKRYANTSISISMFFNVKME